MTISAISPSISASPISNFQTFRQDFNQLTSALQSGDLSGAQTAYATLSSLPLAQGNNPFAQAIQQIGQFLQNNDLPDAQKALAALQQQMQAHGHHHHHGGGGAQGASDAANTSGTNGANASDPDNDGDTSSSETVINIQITVSPGSDNKVDIKA